MLDAPQHTKRYALKAARYRQRLAPFVFKEALRLEQGAALVSRCEEYLREKDILCPARSTLRRDRPRAARALFQREPPSNPDRQPLASELVEDSLAFAMMIKFLARGTGSARARRLTHSCWKPCAGTPQHPAAW